MRLLVASAYVVDVHHAPICRDAGGVLRGRVWLWEWGAGGAVAGRWDGPAQLAHAIDDLRRLCVDERENPAVQHEICRPSANVSSKICEALESSRI